MRPSQVMWYILEDEYMKVELEVGSTDILDYIGESIFLDGDNMLQEFTIDDTFLIQWDWFEDHQDWPRANAYRKGMGCSVQEAFDQWEEAYMGGYMSEAAFSESLHRESIAGLPAFIQSNIDWQGVWDSTDRHDYFESDGFFFQNL